MQTDTERIVRYLQDNGVDAVFELVPGDHYQYAEERLDRAFSRMFLQQSY